MVGPIVTAVLLVVTHDLVDRILVTLAQTHSLFDGNLVKWVHRVLHVLVDTLAVRGDADLDSW